MKVQLVVILSVPPGARRDDFRRDLALVPLLVGLPRDLLGDILLLLVVEVDTAAVVGAGVRALSVQGGGVMHAVEEFEDLTVCNTSRVVMDL